MATAATLIVEAAADHAARHIERDPNRAGYCHAYRISFDNERRGKHQEAETFYASKADAEADAEFYRRQNTAQIADGLIISVRRCYTTEHSVKFGRRTGLRSAA